MSVNVVTVGSATIAELKDGIADTLLNLGKIFVVGFLGHFNVIGIAFFGRLQAAYQMAGLGLDHAEIGR